MSSRQKSAVFSLRNFSGREALWIAVLVHLIILLLPQSFNPFALFWHKFEPPQPEPLKFAFAQQPDQPEQKFEESEILDLPKDQKAITPEKRDDPPQTEQPTMRGQTNLKSLEAPPQQTPAQPQASATPQPTPKERGDEVMEKRETEEQPQPRQPEKNTNTLDEQMARERSRRLVEATENMPAIKPSEIPIQYDNDKSSSADYIEGNIQFDTYNWNYEPYKDKMLRKIYENWVPKLRTISYFFLGKAGITIWRFRIQRDGSVIAMQLLQAAEPPNYDEAAEYGISAPYWNLPTPFPPLPEHFPNKDLGVTIGFYVNTELPSHTRRPTRGLPPRD